ncbi:MAG: DUF4832 domain-containing protein [Lachnospiraceae bacterium]|nr:DUF4832 domain-containing protein [Lachnospiraceae bacterium]
MDKKKSAMIQYLLLVVMGVAIVVLMGYIRTRSDMNLEIEYVPDLTLTDNPLMGYAPNAENVKLCEGSRLVYIPLTWAQWEPREGRYDIASLEKRCNLEKYRKEHKHAVLRFMCDVPGKADHVMDIPGWLYGKTGRGTHYDNELGKGYSPDYGDKVFMDCHLRALKALADYCNRDHFVAFIELGSLGHWGEWHASSDSGASLMPSREVCETYVGWYSDEFINARLLMRRNYAVAVKGNMGFYNDMVGSPEDTGEWLDWLKNGGSQETAGEAITLEPAHALMKERPVGGEFTSKQPMEYLLTEGMSETLREVTESGMTFIGPKVPDYTAKEYALPAMSVLRRTGYRIYVSNLKTEYDYSTNDIVLDLTFKNAGNAGFFFDWPVNVHVYDGTKKEVFWKGLDIDLKELKTDGELNTSVRIPASEELREEFYIGVAITDYTGEENVRLAIDFGGEDEYIGDVQILCHYAGK